MDGALVVIFCQSAKGVENIWQPYPYVFCVLLLVEMILLSTIIYDFLRDDIATARQPIVSLRVYLSNCCILEASSRSFPPSRFCLYSG